MDLSETISALQPGEMKTIISATVEKPKRDLQLLPLVYHPSPILNEECFEIPAVTEDIVWLAKDMLFTMMKRHGVGLAAPQVGHSLRLFVVDVGWVRGIEHSDPKVFINPRVTPASPSQDRAPAEISSTEGCLSFPGTKATLPRYEVVHVHALGIDGRPFELYADELLGRVVQHENDHLNGVTIHPHLGRMQRQELRKGLEKARRG